MKQKKELAVLVVLLLILVAVGYFYFDRDKPVVTADAGSGAQNYQLLPVDNLSLHNAGVEKARKTEYKSGRRNIFSRELPPPPPPPPIKYDKNHPAPPPPPLPPPPEPKVSPLPVKFFGYGTVPNGTARVAFFNDGDDVYIVKEGELLMNRFRILKIGNANLEYEEISSGLRGTANLEDQGGPPSA
jgi:hypothetical protein